VDSDSLAKPVRTTKAYSVELSDQWSMGSVKVGKVAVRVHQVDDQLL